MQLISVVLRESWGWGAKGGGVRLWTRPLSTRRFAEATGLSTDRIARDLRLLVEAGVLLEGEGRYALGGFPQSPCGKAAGDAGPPLDAAGTARERRRNRAL